MYCAHAVQTSDFIVVAPLLLSTPVQSHFPKSLELLSDHKKLLTQKRPI